MRKFGRFLCRLNLHRWGWLRGTYATEYVLVRPGLYRIFTTRQGVCVRPDCTAIKVRRRPDWNEYALPLPEAQGQKEAPHAAP